MHEKPYLLTYINQGRGLRPSFLKPRFTAAVTVSGRGLSAPFHNLLMLNALRKAVFWKHAGQLIAGLRHDNLRNFSTS